MRRYPKVRKKFRYVMFEERGSDRKFQPKPFLRPAMEKTLEMQIRIMRARVMDLMLLVGEPGWKFIKRHPRLYWLWNKSKPLIDAICWFSPVQWSEEDEYKTKR